MNGKIYAISCSGKYYMGELVAQEDKEGEGLEKFAGGTVEVKVDHDMLQECRNAEAAAV